MAYFVKTIKGHNVAFNRIYTITGLKYHVSIRDGIAAHYFMMNERNGGWEIPESVVLPQWIRDMEKAIEKEILNHIAGG